MSALTLHNHLTAQSNVSAAVENGESLEAIDAWLDTFSRAAFQAICQHVCVRRGRQSAAPYVASERPFTV